MASKPVGVYLDGQYRKLRLTLWSVGEVGDRLGIKVKLNSLQEDLLAVPLPLSTLSLLLWAALVHEDKTLTPEIVGGWVDQDNAAEVLSAFFSLFGARLSETTRREIGEKLGVNEGVLTPT